MWNLYLLKTVTNSQSPRFGKSQGTGVNLSLKEKQCNYSPVLHIWDVAILRRFAAVAIL